MTWWVAVLIAVYVLGIGIMAELDRSRLGSTEFDAVMTGVFWPVLGVMGASLVAMIAVGKVLALPGRLLVKAFRRLKR